MDLHETPVGDAGQAVIVEVTGPVGRDSGAALALLARLKGLLAQGYKTILLNVAQVTYMDSVRELFAVTRLNTVFEMVEKEAGLQPLSSPKGTP